VSDKVSDGSPILRGYGFRARLTRRRLSLLCRLLGHQGKLEFFGGPYGLSLYCRRCGRELE
jgi:hypothetical protein